MDPNDTARPPSRVIASILEATQLAASPVALSPCLRCAHSTVLQLSDNSQDTPAGLEASPYPFAMTVALAASTAFMTPVSSPVNMLVVGPGNYRFVDFVKIGVPLAMIALVVTVLLVPVLMPL